MSSRAGVLRLEMCGGSGALLASMNSLRAEGKLCDVTVRLGAAAFPAHRVVLAAGSPYLRDQFLLNPSAGELRVSPLPEPRAALALLLSCYTGHLDVPAAQLVAYLTAASYLQMDHVVERCTKALSEYFQPRFGLHGPRGGSADDGIDGAAGGSPLSERSYGGESEVAPDGAGSSEAEHDRCAGGGTIVAADGIADGAADGAAYNDDERKAFDGTFFGAEKAVPAGRKQQELAPRSLSIVKVEQLSGDEFDGDVHTRRPQLALPQQQHQLHRRQLEAANARHRLSPLTAQNAYALQLPVDPVRHGHFECRRQRMVLAGSPDGATVIAGVFDGEQLEQEETNTQPYFQMPGHSPVYSSSLHHHHHHHAGGTRSGAGSSGLRAGRGTGRFGIVPPSKAKSGRGGARAFFRSAPASPAVAATPSAPSSSTHRPHGELAHAVYSAAHATGLAGAVPPPGGGGGGSAPAKHFECSRCPKTFSHAEVLWAHMRTHKVFMCPRCGRQFSQSSNLTRHLRIHTGVKPFACALCGRCFTQKSSLHDHMNLHSGDRPHRCAHCQVGFAHKPALRRHLREQHQRGAAPAVDGGGGGYGAAAAAAAAAAEEEEEAGTLVDGREGRGGGEEDDEEGPADAVADVDAEGHAAYGLVDGAGDGGGGAYEHALADGPSDKDVDAYVDKDVNGHYF